MDSGKISRFRVRLQLGNTTPSDGRTDAKEFAAAWAELQALGSPEADAPLIISRGADAAYVITIDASDTIDLLDSVSLGDSEGHSKRRPDSGHHPFGSWVDLGVAEVSGRETARPPMQLLGRVLQQLYLAMNLAMPGSFNLLGSTYGDLSDDGYPPPNLSSDILEGAFNQARQRGWPALSRIPVFDTWKWLQNAMSYDVDIAREPSDKALFTLLRVCEPRPVDVDYVLYIAQAFEALFAGGREGIGRTLTKNCAGSRGRASMSSSRTPRTFRRLAARYTNA